MPRRKSEVVEKGRNPASFNELGVYGTRISSGYVMEEFLPALRGSKGQKVYREMSENDSILSAMLTAIEMLARATEWRISHPGKKRGRNEVIGEDTYQEVGSDEEGNKKEEARTWLSGVLFEDMDDSWDNFISDGLSMLVYGWAWFEIVLKRRMGTEAIDPQYRSEFDDGMIGIRKLAIRSQESLEHWELAKNGDVMGMWQQPPMEGGVRYIPIEKSLHFKPKSAKCSPEGKSLLRGAYRSWYFMKRMQEIEAIAAERELNGLPVAYIPSEILGATEGAALTAKNNYIKLVRDIRYNEQGGIVVPSDPWTDIEGNPSQLRKVEIKLLSANGNRAIDTNRVITRYQFDEARVALADFIMIGGNDRGSFAMSQSKVDIFLRAMVGWLECFSSPINKRLIPWLWAVNGFDRKYMPKLQPGPVAPEDLEKLGGYIEKLFNAGMKMFPDEETETRLRRAAGLPDPDPKLSVLYDMELEGKKIGLENMKNPKPIIQPQNNNQNNQNQNKQPNKNKGKK